MNDVAGKLTPFVYVAPTLIMVVVFLLFPLVSVFYYSFTEWNGFTAMRPVGFANYVHLIKDALFWAAFKTNLIYVVFFSLIPTFFGLVLAALISRGRLLGMRLFRTLLLTPQVVTSVAMGVIFGWIFAPQFGVLNSFLAILGLSSWQQPWLGAGGTAPIAVGVVGVWLWLGFCTVIFLAGMQKIDPSLYDAAELDGANAGQEFLHITLPALRTEIVVLIIITLIRAFGSSIFGIVQVITGGGYHTRPISLYAYQLAFVQNKIGYGSAVTVFLIIVIGAFSLLALKLGEERR
jgi:raffinose/stachyose/melibiose transport system permease protein